MVNRSNAIIVRLALLVLICTLAACGEGSPPARAPLSTPPPIGIETPAPGSIYLGAYVDPTVSTITQLESGIAPGYTFGMASRYYEWVNLFPTIAEQSDLSYGRLSVDAWDCGIPDAQVAAGAADPVIQTRALALKAFGKPIFLRFMWDPNLPSSQLSRSACIDPATDGSSGNFSAAEYVAAYRHVHAIFQQEGVNNVIWVWSYSSTGSNPSAYYPGNDVVDWIGVDAINTAGVSFASLFGPIYPFASQYNKPILISETGSVPNNQQVYLDSITQAVAQQYPLLDGIIYYDGTLYGVPLTFGPEGLASIATLAGTPYFSARGTL